MRLIDADELLSTLEKGQAYLEEESLIDRSLGIGDAIIDLLSVPTVDAVDRELYEQCKFDKDIAEEQLKKIVRCKDCKWWEGCRMLDDDNGYCSDGERKEE